MVDVALKDLSTIIIIIYYYYYLLLLLLILKIRTTIYN